MEITQRQRMLLAGLLQGLMLLGLHDWLHDRANLGHDLWWIAPLYVLATLVPLTFNFLHGANNLRASLKAALGVSVVLALSAAWVGWANNVETLNHLTSQYSYYRNYWLSEAFVFSSSALVVWFVAMPFVQSWLRGRRGRVDYAELFQDAWRNTLLVANALFFTLIFWLLLMLWAGLFAVLDIRFFKELFESHRFIYPATTTAISFALSLEEYEANALTAIRCNLLRFQTWLLPLAAAIALMFLGATAFSGVALIWKTGYATALMLTLLLILVVLINAAWQDGKQAPPFARVTTMVIRLAVAVMPVMAALCVWAMTLRVQQYGWTVDRVWAAVIVALVCVYAVGYAWGAVKSPWLANIGRVNVLVACLIIASLVALNSPVLDPQRISANSQVARLLAGKVQAAKFNYAYLRFDLGRAGNTQLIALSQTNAHPQAADIRAGASEALKKQTRYNSASQESAITEAELAAKFKVFPQGAVLDTDFVRYLVGRMNKPQSDYRVSSLHNQNNLPVLLVDLGGDSTPEVVIFSNYRMVFSKDSIGWHEIGELQFAGRQEVLSSLENHDYAAEAGEWKDVKLGGAVSQLILRREAE